MNFKSLIRALLSSSLILGAVSVQAADKGMRIAVVDFAKCVTESKHGKAEQANFESIRMQMQKAIEDLDAQMNETANKLQDKDLLDSLSPEAENELKTRFQTLGEELNRYHSQYYQVMQQANMKLVHTMSSLINQASEVIAKKDKWDLIMNKEAAFHFNQDLDVTSNIIQELNKKFEKEEKAQSKPELVDAAKSDAKSVK